MPNIIAGVAIIRGTSCCGHTQPASSGRHVFCGALQAPLRCAATASATNSGTPRQVGLKLRADRGRHPVPVDMFLQELIRRGVLAPSFIVSYSHADAEIDKTIEAIDGALGAYKRARIGPEAGVRAGATRRGIQIEAGARLGAR